MCLYSVPLLQRDSLSRSLIVHYMSFSFKLISCCGVEIMYKSKTRAREEH